MSHYPRVNAALMANFQGSPVCMVGKLTKAESSGTIFQVLSPDSKTINVTLSEPLSMYLDGYVEVFGTVVGKDTIQADRFNVLPGDVNFEMDTYNETVKLLQTTSGPW